MDPVGAWARLAAGGPWTAVAHPVRRRAARMPARRTASDLRAELASRVGEGLRDRPRQARAEALEELPEVLERREPFARLAAERLPELGRRDAEPFGVQRSGRPHLAAPRFLTTYAAADALD